MHGIAEIYAPTFHPATSKTDTARRWHKTRSHKIGTRLFSFVKIHHTETDLAFHRAAQADVATDDGSLWDQG